MNPHLKAWGAFTLADLIQLYLCCLQGTPGVMESCRTPVCACVCVSCVSKITHLTRVWPPPHTDVTFGSMCLFLKARCPNPGMIEIEQTELALYTPADFVNKMSFCLVLIENLKFGLLTVPPLGVLYRQTACLSVSSDLFRNNPQLLINPGCWLRAPDTNIWKSYNYQLSSLFCWLMTEKAGTYIRALHSECIAAVTGSQQACASIKNPC